MKTQDFWQTFTKTGSIYDYLSYKNSENIAANGVSSEVQKDEHQNQSGSCENKEYR